VVSTALAIVAGFTVTGVFVASVATRSESDVVVLATPGMCGKWTWTLDGGLDAAFLLANSQLVQDTLRGRAYAKAWYSGSSAAVTTPRSILPVTALPYNASMGPCPFPGDNRCL
jgi:hypothetical protein